MFGTSRQLALGPVATSSLLTSQAIGALQLTDATEYAQAAVLMSFLAGVVQLVLGLLKLGVLANFLAQPVVSGFATASGVMITISQLPSALGVKAKVDQSSTYGIAATVVGALAAGDVNVSALVVALCAIALLWLLRVAKQRLRLRFAVPGALIVVVVATIVSFAADLHARFGTKVLGSVPLTYPNPQPLSLAHASDLVVSGILIAFVGYMEAMGGSAAFAFKHDYKLDSSQEFVALGLAKLVGAFFGSIAVTGGLSRTAVADQVRRQRGRLYVVEI